MIPMMTGRHLLEVASIVAVTPPDCRSPSHSIVVEAVAMHHYSDPSDRRRLDHSCGRYFRHGDV